MTCPWELPTSISPPVVLLVKYAGSIYIDWLIGWLVDWLIDWLIGWLIDWLIDWMFLHGNCKISILQLFLFLHPYHPLPLVWLRHGTPMQQLWTLSIMTCRIFQMWLSSLWRSLFFIFYFSWNSLLFSTKDFFWTTTNALQVRINSAKYLTSNIHVDCTLLLPTTHVTCVSHLSKLKQSYYRSKYIGASRPLNFTCC